MPDPRAARAAAIQRAHDRRAPACPRRSPGRPSNASSARRLGSLGATPATGARASPVHTVYGGAHLFASARRASSASSRCARSTTYAPDAASFCEAIGVRAPKLAPKVYDRVREKLRREPVEDFRIDFEDGYGNRPDAEEDGHAAAAAQRGGRRACAAGTLPPFIGIRIKPLTRELARARCARSTFS